MIVTLLRQNGIRNGSGAVLAKALGVPHGGPNGERRTRQDRYIINYGVTEQPLWQQRTVQYSNSRTAITLCVDKRLTLRKLAEANVPSLEFTDLENTAMMWLREDGKVVVRKILNGHSGAGIEIFRGPNEEDIPEAPLYTRYFKKDAEYRVHVAFGKVILIQQKKRGENYNGDVDFNRLVRTNANGWVFCISDLDCDARNYRESLSTLALAAAAAVGLNHGAVDILVKHKRDAAPVCVVCEINTAPALRNPSTLQAYVGAFREQLTNVQ
jgi:hypothetical protein